MGGGTDGRADELENTYGVVQLLGFMTEAEYIEQRGPI
jgi:hypothetical protein